MPIKGMRSLFFHHHHNSSTPSSPVPPSPRRTTFSATLMSENISLAEEIIIKWNPQASDYARRTFLFAENRHEAQLFLRAVADLRRAMHFFIEDSPVSSSQTLHHAQILMQTAMKRLEKEFYQILSASRDSLDPGSVSPLSSDNYGRRSSVSEDDDDVRDAQDNGALADLRSIAECMISSGYGRECVKIYKTIRRSIVDEGLYKLGFEKLTPSQIQKMDWDVLELRLQSWLGAARIAVGTLFAGERILSDHVFAASDSIRQSCFAEVARDPAVDLLAFPELVTRAKRSPERMFRVLDVYESLTELLPDIESIFYHEATSAVRSQGLSSLRKLGEAIRSMILDFEAVIQKDASKASIPGGGLHPLTRYVTNNLTLLADYSGVLTDIFRDNPLPDRASLRNAFDSSSLGRGSSPSWSSSASNSTPSSPSSFEEHPLGAASARLARLILVLLCKLDRKAEVYPDVALSYLFLANNLQYIVNKVNGSKLSDLLGEEWVARHAAMARTYAANFERLGWGKVLAAIPEDMGEVVEAGTARDRMRRFNEAFEEACRGQAGWVVADGRLRKEVKVSIATQIIPAYRPFYERCRSLTGAGDDSVAVVRFAPKELGKHISDLYNEPSDRWV